jgi:hypothetical protein
VPEQALFCFDNGLIGGGTGGRGANEEDRALVGYEGIDAKER